MTEIKETLLPGVGVRHELVTAAGERVAVVTRRDGRREVAVYEDRDPDACHTVLRLDADDARSLVEVLGGSQVSETVQAVQQEIEGLGIEWLALPASSPFAGRTIRDGSMRTRTGASIVAILRGGTTIPAPLPDQRLEAGDVVVAVGTAEGLALLRDILVP